MMNKNNTRKVLYFSSLLVMFLVLTTFAVEASSVIRSGDTVSLSEDQVIQGDFYTAGGKVNLSGAIEEDLLSAGGQVTLNGSVGGDVFIIAGQADIHGTVGDDLRILAGEVTIAEPVMGDVFVIGGVVNILSTASVAGDIVIFGGEVTVEGSVGGDIVGTIDSLRVDAQVAGNIDVTASQLTLGDRANVEGSVRYVSNNLVIQSLNSTVSGELTRSDPVLVTGTSDIRSALVPMLILLFSILVWYWVSRRSLQLVVDRALTKRIRPFAFGFATLMLAPLAIGMLFVSMIGSLVALVGLFGYLLLLILSLVGLPAVLGQLLLRAFNQSSDKVSLISLVVGVIGLALLLLLPIVGHTIMFGLMILTLGSMVDILVRPKVN